MAGDAHALYQEGVRAIRDERDMTQGRRLLIDSLRADPDNDAAWVWLSHTVTDPGKKLDCLERALLINPSNRQALDAKMRLQNGSNASVAKRSTQEIFGSPAPTKRTTQSMRVSSGESGKSTSDLGRLIETVGLNKWELAKKIIAVILGLGVAILFFYVSRSTKVTDTQNFKIVCVIAGILCLVGVVYLCYSIVMSIGIQVAVHENGIRRTRADKTESWRWEDFTALRVAEQIQTYRYSGIPVARFHTYDCRMMQDKKVVLHLNKDIKRYREVGNYIAQKTTPIFFERNYKAHRNGETTYYGKLEVNRDGIREGRRSIAWDEIASWNVENGGLSIKKVGRGKFDVYLVDRPNAYVLLAMIEKIKSHNY